MPTQLLGLSEIQAALDQLPDKMQQNVLRAGNRAVANEVRKEIAASPNLPATIRAAATAQPNPKAQATKGFLVGLRKPFSSLSHLFEFGTRPRFRKSGGYTGRMPAAPWLRPALEAVGARAEAVWTKAASRNLATQLKKLGLNDR